MSCGSLLLPILPSKTKSPLQKVMNGVAHDLKSPLSAFALCMDVTEMLISDAKNPHLDAKRDFETYFITELQKTLQGMEEACKNMHMIVNRCITYSQAASGEILIPNMSPVHVVTTTRNVVDLCRRQIDDQVSISLTVDRAVDKNLTILTDREWFEENLLSLLQNAIKFSLHHNRSDSYHQARQEVGDIEVIVSITENNHFHIQVKDRGIGVPLANRASLFSGHQVQVVDFESGGAGLGLFTLACRCAALNGSAHYSPNVASNGNEKGSLFSFEFPIMEAPSAEALQHHHHHREDRLPRVVDAVKSYNENEDQEESPMIRHEAQGCQYHHVKPVQGRIQIFPPVHDSGAPRKPQLSPQLRHRTLLVPPCQEQLLLNDNVKNMKKRSFVDAKEESALTASSSLDGRIYSKRPLRILVVDDSSTIRKMSAMALQKLGHKVIVAVDGYEALSCMLRSLPNKRADDGEEEECLDIVLMDVQMPVMDGLSAAKAYRSAENAALNKEANNGMKEQKKLLIVGMSACNEDKSAMTEIVKAVGMNYFLPKPFTVHRFTNLLANIDDDNANNESNIDN